MKLEEVYLTDINNTYFDHAWGLYINSFPQTEKRTLEEQERIMKKEKYTALAIKEKGKEKIVAILFFWNLEKYTFLEHFAISPTLRGKGYGSKLIKDFISKHKNTVLEIEPITNEITQKRFDFYKKFDFVINEHKHYQVPFRKDEEELELLFLSHKKSLFKEQYIHLYKEMNKNLTL